MVLKYLEFNIFYENSVKLELTIIQEVNLSIEVKENKIIIKSLEIDNEVAAEFLQSHPKRDHETIVSRALGIGILAEIKGEIANFLHETESDLGNRLGILQTLYDLRNIRFNETSQKGVLAETVVIEALRDISKNLGFEDDIADASTVAGKIPRNKTGDVLIRLNGDEDKVVGVEVKLDKGVSYGDLLKRDPLAKTDTAISQLAETAANRGSNVNIIVFDVSNADNSVMQRCINGITYEPGLGFIVLIDTLKADFKSLGVAYSLSREITLSKTHQDDLDQNLLKLMLMQMVKLFTDYSSVKSEADSIKKSAGRIIEISERTRLLAEHSAAILSKYLDTGKLTKIEVLEYLQANEPREELNRFKKDLGI